MSKERRLGRGLAALLSTPEPPPAPSVRIHDPEQTASAPPSSVSPETYDPNRDGDGAMMLIAVDQIDDNPFQPRRIFSESEIVSLSESLKTHDMLQPVIVRPVGARWQLISGERRLRAAIRAGWTQVPARVRNADDRLVAELAIVENLQRKDLNAIEKALSFQRYLEQHGCTQDELGQRLKIDRSTIANLLRLLELPEPVKQAVQQGNITAGHARALLPLGDEPQQIAFCRRIGEEGLSVREVERQVQEKIRSDDAEPLSVVGAPGGASKPARPRSDQLAALEQELRIALGTKVEIRQTRSGRGRLVLHFANHDEFDRLRQLLHAPTAAATSAAG